MARAVVVVGSANVDLVVRCPRLPRPGETVLGGSFFQAQGGKGANQAVAAARLASQSVRLIAALGVDPLGKQSLRLLADENLIVDSVVEIAEQPTGVALILVDERGENMISVASGANLSLTPAHVADALARSAVEGGVLVASAESPPAAVRESLSIGRRRSMTTILNPAPAAAWLAEGELLRCVDVLTPNEHEATALAGRESPTSGSEDLTGVETAARALCARGAGACVVTLGALGALIVRADETAVHVPAKPVRAVDTTAAGDCFNGALAVALAEGESLVNAVRFATRAAAISVTRLGAQPSLPRREELRDA